MAQRHVREARDSVEVHKIGSPVREKVHNETLLVECGDGRREHAVTCTPRALEEHGGEMLRKNRGSSGEPSEIVEVTAREDTNHAGMMCNMKSYEEPEDKSLKRAEDYPLAMPQGNTEAMLCVAAAVAYPRDGHQGQPSKSGPESHMA